MSDHPILSVLARIEDRLEQIDTSLKTFRVDSMALGTEESVRRAHDNTREEPRGVHETVTVLYRKVNRLETEVRELRGDP